MDISSREMVKTSQLNDEKEICVMFRKNRNGDIVSWYVDADGEDVELISTFLRKNLGNPPYILS